MAKVTPATRALDQARVPYILHTYAYDPSAEKIGLQAAEGVGVSAARVFKTLMVLVDGKPACVLVPSDCETSMKKVAALFGGKAAQMMRPEEAEKLTGYHVGGISPLGGRRRVPVAVDERALAFETIFINGGQRGLQAELAPDALLSVLGAKCGALVVTE